MNRAPEQLNGWKEIACYLNRSVRCVQRWERNENLPVRRHGHRRGVSVYAFREELSAWWEHEGARSEQFHFEPIELAAKEKSQVRRGAIGNDTVVLPAATRELGTPDLRPVGFALTSHEVTALRFFLMLLTASTAQELHHSTTP